MRFDTSLASVPLLFCGNLTKRPLPPCVSPVLWTEQDFNDGGAPFPYATACTVSTATCDPESLVSVMDISEDAVPTTLDIATGSNASDAVDLVRNCNDASVSFVG